MKRLIPLKPNTVWWFGIMTFLKREGEHDPQAKELYDLFIEYAKWLKKATEEL